VRPSLFRTASTKSAYVKCYSEWTNKAESCSSTTDFMGKADFRGNNMKQEDALEVVLNKVKSKDTATAKLRVLLNHEAILVRVNAADALAQRIHLDGEIVDDLVRAAINPSNSGARLMGTITVSHVIVGALLKSQERTAVEAGQQLLAQWPNSERTDLLWYLKSERILDQENG